MVVIPAGRFHIGCDRRAERDCPRRRRPVREVRFDTPFALSKYEVTFEDYDRYLVAKGGGRHGEADDAGWGRGRRPVINVTRADALAYAAWLSAEAGERYRLPSEAEWEYAVRAGTTTQWWWGDELVPGRANCPDCGSRWEGRTAPVGSFRPNPWGLHDMAGNVLEMLLDCWHSDYKTLPTDGTARTSPGRWWDTDDAGNCETHAVRGGGWLFVSEYTRSSRRLALSYEYYGPFLGIRLARDIDDGQAAHGPSGVHGRRVTVALLAKRFDQEVDVTTTVDAKVVGGAVIRAGDTVFDGSVRGKLDKLAESLGRA